MVSHPIVDKLQSFPIIDIAKGVYDQKPIRSYVESSFALAEFVLSLYELNLIDKNGLHFTDPNFDPKK